MILNYRQKHTPWPEEGLEVLEECEWVDKIGKKSILLEMLLKKKCQKTEKFGLSPGRAAG